MKGMIIRNALKEEIDTIYLMGYKTFQDKNKYDWGWGKEILNSFLNPSYGICHVAETNNKILGFILGVWNYPESSEIQCRIIWIYVLPEYRRQGVATNLIGNLLKMAKEKGKKSVCAGVWGSDTIVHNLIAKWSFKPRETLIIYQLRM